LHDVFIKLGENGSRSIGDIVRVVAVDADGEYIMKSVLYFNGHKVRPEHRNTVTKS
jgi:hypothetical protein